MVFAPPVVEQWLKGEIAQWVHHEGLNTRDLITHIITDVSQRFTNPVVHSSALCISLIIYVLT